MFSQLVAGEGQLKFGGVVCSPSGTIKLPFELTSCVPARARRRFTPLPCELQHDNAARNVMADAPTALFDVGSLNSTGMFQLFTEGGITLLSEIPMASTPGFGAAANGICTGNSLPWTDLAAVGSGFASEFTALDRDENPVLSGHVGSSGQELNFPHLEIAVNDIVKILSASYTAPP